MAASIPADLSWSRRLQNYWVNDGPKVVFMFLFLAANVVVFLESFISFKNSKFFAALSYGVCLAKGSAGSIKLTSALILIPVCRNFLSWLRGTFVNNYIPIDKNLIFHKFCAWLIALMTAIHVAAHFWNFQKIERAPLGALQSLGLPFTEVPSARFLSFYSLAGSTGHLALLCMVMMYSSAVESIRRGFFEAFWYSHHLFIFYYILVSIHAAQALFGAPTFAYFIIGPLFFYTIERTVRVMRGKQTTMLVLARQHPSKVIELRMRKASFRYKPGQYLFLNCPYLSKHEWHPFTITSAPDEDFVSVHINAAGNWTTGLTTLLNPDKKIGIVQQDLLEAPDGSSILRIDGPFGAASEEVFEYKTVMLVGAGIGVTPFASILKHIKNLIKRSGSKAPIDKVYFFWICRDKNSFEWFSNMLAALERENINGFLEINTFLTGGLSSDEIKNVMYGEEEEGDQITGLSSPTQFGRPRWPDIFLEISRKHQNSDVGVFFCGPRVLSKELYKNARRFTSTKDGGCRFHYNKENF